MKLFAPLALALLAACGSSSKPADEPAVVAPTADAAPAGDPRELTCKQNLARFGEGSPDALAGCVAAFADREEAAACVAAGKGDDYADCYGFCLGGVGIEPDPAIPVDDQWSDAVENCVAGCSQTECPQD